MEAHGGYLFRSSPHSVAPQSLARLAREALAEDADGVGDCSLQLTMLPELSVVRLAFDAPFTYGRRGARWYERHHALARLLSEGTGLTVHTYVLDPSEFEQVTSYGNGHLVGGERLVYEELEVDEEELEDEEAYERLKERWPLGHLARVFGAARSDLVRLPRSPTLLINLDDGTCDGSVTQLLSRRLG